MYKIPAIPIRFLFFILFFSVLTTSCSSSRTIVNGIEEKEANEILVYLNNKGIHASKVANVAAGGGAGGRQAIALYDIQVPENQANEAMALLNIAGLPRKQGQNLLGIFGGGGLVPSQMEEKIRFQQGLAEQIASTLRKIDGVIDADVLLTFPEEDPLNPEKSKSKITAAVFIKHNGILDDPNANLVSKIKRLVSSSIPSLDYDNVTVIGDRARNTSFLPDTTSATNQEKAVNIWGLAIEENSLTRFQLIFFSLISLLILFFLAFVWMVWKCFHVIQKAGGFKELLRVAPIHVEETPLESEQVEEQQEPEEAPEEEEGLEPEIEEEKPPQKPEKPPTKR